MKRLAPDLLDRRFDDLVDMGRSRLPGLAPDWTDYNAHDPGITLMELLAWVTEAQLYSVGRTRRDERASYAALFGLAPGGTRPARGLVWPDRLDSRSPAATCAQSRVIAADAVTNPLDTDMPTFRPERKLLWVAARMRRLSARLADGREIDLTAINQRDGLAFQPFGAAAGKNDVLVMALECRGDDGLFPPKRADADGALWPIGIRADVPLEPTIAGPDARFAPAGTATSAVSLAVTLVTSKQRIPLRIVSDSSEGMLRTGVLLLDLSPVPDSPREFTIELRAIRGFERPPRVLRIEPNVLPIVQGCPIRNEMHQAPEPGIPDWSFQLDVPGLRYEPAEIPVAIEQRDPETNRRVEWRSARLADSGPDDAVFELDAATRRVTFGNGVNGRIPPDGSTMLATYAVCDGVAGGVAANRKWRVTGFLGAFGVNPDAVGGGSAPTDSIDARREARRRSRDDHALVSANDIESAARALPLLEVVRAWVLAPDENAPRTGAVTLMAMRGRTSEEEAGSTPENARWLEAIRRRLVARMPLASRLVVIGPRYVEFSIDASIESVAGRDPVEVASAIERELAGRLALTGASARRPGVPVTKRDLVAWIRVVEGVRRVATLRLRLGSGEEVDDIAVSRNGLPRFDSRSSDIEVRRATSRTER